MRILIDEGSYRGLLANMDCNVVVISNASRAITFTFRPIFFGDDWYDTKSNVKLGRFRSQLQASYVSNHTEELWYNETVCQNKINKFKRYKSLRGPFYLKIYPYSFFGPTTTIYIYIYIYAKYLLQMQRTHAKCSIVMANQATLLQIIENTASL